MTLSEKYAQLDKLKNWLDSFRPLPSTVVVELKQLFDVRFTYNSNAIEGNTLTQSETQPHYLLPELMAEFVEWLNSEGAKQQDSLVAFQELILEAAKDSLVEVLRVVVTATESQSKGEGFYDEILSFLNDFQI